MSGGAPPKARVSSARTQLLIAEDDDNIAQVLTGALQGRDDVHRAGDGHEAVAMASHDPPPDLLLLDAMMPGIDGFQVAEQTHLLPDRSTVPIVFTTALDGPRDIVRGIQSGARRYLIKPFRVTEALESVRDVLGV